MTHLDQTFRGFFADSIEQYKRSPQGYATDGAFLLQQTQNMIFGLRRGLRSNCVHSACRRREQPPDRDKDVSGGTHGFIEALDGQRGTPHLHSHHLLGSLPSSVARSS